MADLLAEHISLPSASYNMFVGSVKSDKFFICLPEKLDLSVRESLVGGPCIVYRRHAKVGETLIREQDFGDKAKPMAEIIGYDVVSGIFS